MESDELKLYELYLTKIKETDEISFKLMGLVPLLSGAGVLALLKGDKVFSGNDDIDLAAYWLIGLFGALVTFLIFRWELRNIDTCRFFREFAASFESEEGPYKRLTDDKETRTFLGRRFGKTEAEKAIYVVSILFWVALPIMKSIF